MIPRHTCVYLRIMPNKYRIKEFAKRIGKSADTVRRWEREGKLKAKRYPSGQRYFDESDVRQVLGYQYLEIDNAAVEQALDVFCEAGRDAVKIWLKTR